jgi:hypothetical protein
MNADEGGVMRFPSPGAKVLYADQQGVLHARPTCRTVDYELAARIDPGDDEPRCKACCDDLVET